MEKELNFEVLEMLAIGPETQIDLALGKRLKKLRSLPKDEQLPELRQIIIDSIDGSLVSGFVLTVLQMEYKRVTGESVTGQIRMEKLNL